MNLINNYLRETSKHLPEEGREDILNELRSSLEEQVFDQAEANKREVSVEDEKAVLLKFGHPVRLAASYKRAQYLIGPALYPAYIQSLKIGMTISLSIQFVVGFIYSISSDWNTSFGFVVERIFDTAFWLVTVVTLVFMALEYSSEKLNWYSNWHPDSLSDKPTSSVDSSDMISNIITEGIFLLWWNGILVFVSDADLGQMILSPIWEPLFWPINLLVGVSFLLHVYLVLDGSWTRPLLCAELFSGISGVVFVCYLLLNRPLSVIHNVVDGNDSIWVEQLATGVLVVIVLVWLWDISKYLRMLRSM